MAADEMDIELRMILEILARDLAEQIRRIRSGWEWLKWRKKHSRTLSILFRELPSGPAKRELLAAGRAKKEQFTNFRIVHPRRAHAWQSTR